MNSPLMPKATAVWLVDNTSLSFEQIAAFCGLHPLEVKGIADGEVAQGIKGLDPVAAGQLTRDEIERGERDPHYQLKISTAKHAVPEIRKRSPRGPRYTPVSRRQDRPNAIAWLMRHHPELTDTQIGKLVGTTKSTIQAIRDRTHWNMANIKPIDPVTVGLCSQVELDSAVQKAAARSAKQAAKAGAEQPGAGTLKPVQDIVTPRPAETAAPEEEDMRDKALDLSRVFGPRPSNG